MALHPNEQKRAQEEIDMIVGRDRLPTFDDRPSLPYVEALYREVLRWRTTGPLGFPHAALNDDTYKGYYIPKGTKKSIYVWPPTEPQSVRLRCPGKHLVKT